MSGTERHRLNLTRLTGMPVRDRQGRVLGEIQEVVLDLSEGSIDYATITLTSQDCGRAEVAVPWSQFQLSPDDRYVELDISLAVLKAVASRRARR